MEDDYSYDNDSFFSDRRQSSFCMGLDKVPVWPGTVLHLPAVVCVGNIFRCISCCMAADRYSRPDFRAGIYESDMMGQGDVSICPKWDKSKRPPVSHRRPDMSCLRCLKLVITQQARHCKKSIFVLY